MKAMSDFVQEFARGVGIHPEQTDIPAVTEAFMSEMEAGLSGGGSSLAMIPTYISVKGKPPEDRDVIAVDAGGTNLRVGLVSFKNGLPVTRGLKKYPMPGSRGEITADEFFDYLAELILPLTKTADCVGFCFSYPMEITENLDGIIEFLNKEVKVRGSEGRIIGQSIAEKLREKGLSKPLRFVIINDTVAGLMGGMACLGLSGEGGLAGLILGTGSNTCYLEKGSRVTKLRNAGDMLINCESGNFSGAHRGLPDKILDSGTKDPGKFLFEKMMSGAYLGRLVTETAILAASQGVLSPVFGELAEQPITAPELDEFLRGADNRISGLCSGRDRERLTTLGDLLFDRSAKLICAVISALCLHSGGGLSPQSPFTVVAEGSMFWESLLFREKLNGYLSSHVEGTLKRHVQIVRAENSTMAGAALSALLNC